MIVSHKHYSENLDTYFVVNKLCSRSLTVIEIIKEEEERR
jgi:hypothetical protein